jgi:IS5 family transposase
MGFDYRQGGFADEFVQTKGISEKNLRGLDQVLDWDSIEKIVRPVYRNAVGRPSYPALVMAKLLLLQQWYGLSDPGLEEAVDDRLSFRRFAGIPLDRNVPDHATIWRFREALGRLGLSAKLFEEVNRQLEAKGVFVKQGTLVDATIVQAAVNPPPFREGQVSELDPDAGFTRKNGTTYFGYKGHVGVDEGSTLIRRQLMTPADVADTLVFADVIVGDEAFACADKAYGSAANRAMLEAAGIEDRLMYKASRGHPLKEWQEWFNKAVSPMRSAVERPFAHMKQIMGYRRCRYRGLRRNGCAFDLLCAAYNIRRARSLLATA